MNRFLTVTLTIVFVALCASCSQGDYRHISQDKARAIMKFNPKVILLDVRTQEEYLNRHITNAVLIPLEDLQSGIFSKITDREIPIIIYCRTGRCAKEAAEILSENGYQNIYEMGSIVEWTGSVSGSEVK